MVYHCIYCIRKILPRNCWSTKFSFRRRQQFYQFIQENIKKWAFWRVLLDLRGSKFQQVRTYNKKEITWRQPQAWIMKKDWSGRLTMRLRGFQILISRVTKLFQKTPARNCFYVLLVIWSLKWQLNSTILDQKQP